MNEPGSSPAAGRVIVLTAPPGAGKSTVAALLAAAPGAGKSTVAALLAAALDPSVHVHADDFWHFIKRGAIPPYLPSSHRQNEVVVGVLAAAAFGYAAGGYHVICDGIVGPWFLPPFRAGAVAAHPVRRARRA